MNEKHILFCLEYLKDFNGTRAYRVVYERGAPLKNPRASAGKLLARGDVKNYLAERINKAERECIAQSDEVMAYFTSVMRGEIEMSDRERNKAAELLAKRFGLLEDRRFEDSDSGGVTIVDDVGG